MQYRGSTLSRPPQVSYGICGVCRPVLPRAHPNARGTAALVGIVAGPRINGSTENRALSNGSSQPKTLRPKKWPPRRCNDRVSCDDLTDIELSEVIARKGES